MENIQKNVNFATKNNDIVTEINAVIQCRSSEFVNSLGEKIKYKKYFIPFEVSGEKVSISIDTKANPYLKPLLASAFHGAKIIQGGEIKKQ